MLPGRCSLFAFALADAALALVRLRWPPRAVIAAVWAPSLAAALAVATLLSIALISGTGGETYFRVEAVVAVLWALGTALIPLLRGCTGRLERPRHS